MHTPSRKAVTAPGPAAAAAADTRDRRRSRHVAFANTNTTEAMTATVITAANGGRHVVSSTSGTGRPPAPASGRIEGPPPGTIEITISAAAAARQRLPQQQPAPTTFTAKTFRSSITCIKLQVIR